MKGSAICGTGELDEKQERMFAQAAITGSIKIVLSVEQLSLGHLA